MKRFLWSKLLPSTLGEVWGGGVQGGSPSLPSRGGDLLAPMQRV